MSVRYCIGRKSISAVTHAASVARYIIDHWDSYNDKDMLYVDINRELDNYYDPYVKKDGIHWNGQNTLVMILDYLADHDPDYAFSLYINHYDGTCTPEPIEGTGFDRKSFWSDVGSYMPWIKLMQLLRPEFDITYLDNGKEVTVPAIKYYDDGKVYYCTVESYKQYPSKDIFVTDYIKVEPRAFK